MGLEILNPLRLGGVSPNSSVRTGKLVSFAPIGADTFERLSLDRFISERAIKNMIASNPKIKNIVKSFNPELRLNMEELRVLVSGHAKDTQNIVKGIAENLPYSTQLKIDKQSLSDAAYLHDIGKVLIPKEILNKPAKLTKSEFQVMNTHSDIGYELLKNSGLNPKILYLIKNHHKNSGILNKFANKSRYNDVMLQILTTADKYSALTESRVYKAPLSSKEALTIIYEDVKKGDLNPLVFNALVNYSNSLDRTASQLLSK